MKKKYVLPPYKKLCPACKEYRNFKSNWNCCLACWEKKFGKYKGEDREIYIYKKPTKK